MALTRLTKIDGGGISTTSDYRVGVITATKFVGPIEAENATFAGNVSIGGTLTYEDVTNIDSVGLITARDGIKVGVGITLDPIGDAEFCGIVTFNNRRGGVAAQFPNNEMLVFGNNYLYGNIRNTGSQLTFDALNTYRFNCWDGNSMEQWMGVSGVSGSITLGGYNMGTGSARSPRFQILGSNHLLKMYSSDPSSTTLTERFSLSQSGINFTGLSTHTGNFDLDGDITVGTGVTIEQNGNSNFVGVSSLGTGATGAVYLYNPDADALSGTTNDIYGWKAKTYTGGLQVNSAIYLSRSGSNGLQLTYNNATGSYITALSGFLRLGVPYGGYFNIYSNDVYIKNSSQDSTFAHFEKVSNFLTKTHLYSQNQIKLSTEPSGISVVGTTTSTQLAVTGVSTFSDDVWFKGATTNRDAYWDKSDNSLEFYDNAKAAFGTNSKATLHHSGTQFYIQNTQGGLYLRNNNKNSLLATPSDEIWLYHNNDIKLKTSAKGITVGTGVTVETNGQSNFSGITTFSKGIYITEPYNYHQVQTLGFPNLDMPFVLYAHGGGSTGISTALFTGGYGTRPEVVFEQRHGGNFVDAYPHSAPWKVKWTMPNDNDTTDDQVEIKPVVSTSGALAWLQIRTTDNSNGLRNTLNLSSSTTQLYVDNNIKVMLDSSALHVADYLGHLYDTDTRIGFPQNDKVIIQAGGTTRFQTNSIGAQIDTTLLLYGPAGNPGRLRLQEGGALSEIRVGRNSDSSSFLFFATEIAGTTDIRNTIDESGHFRPWVDSTYDLGITGTRWRRVYADTYYGDGSNLTGIAGDKIFEGNTEVETIDTGSNGIIKFTTEGSERLRIDTSGRLLIGTTTEGNSSADNLTVADSGESGITVRSGTSQGGHIYFSDATSGTAEYQGLVSYQHNGDFMKFGTAATERLRIDSSGGMKQTSTEAFQIAKGTTAERPSSPVVGMLRFNTTTDLLENYNSSGWSAVNVKVPVITSITGEIYAGLPSNLTINGTDFTSTVSITFKEGSTTLATLTNQSVSSGSVTVSVPSGVYGQSAGDTITITLTNSDGVASGGTNKTVQATPSGGNSITTSGDYRIHTFTSSGTFSTPSGWSSTYDYVVVAGGGSGGNNKQGGYENGGGGGAGGMLTGSSSLAASTNYSISIGGGGARPGGDGQTRGGNTTAFGLTAIGGGGGRTRDTGLGNCNGGSGGGTTNWDDVNSPGSGTSGQGNRGGYATQVGNPQGGSGGGGGKGAVGGGGSGTTGASGGSGGSTSIRGSSETFAGGGGGGGGSGGSGGSGGGGQAGNSNSQNGSNGSSNTGGGGGGNYAPDGNAGNGGSGIVIVRYKKT